MYGPVRSGTTLMGNLIAASARVRVSDWGIGPILLGPRGVDIPYDLARHRRDVARNVLTTAPAGDGRQLDLVFKQANLRPEPYDALVATFGPPERVVFCLREPGAFLASALRKFPDTPVDRQIEHSYLGTIAAFERIGGDVFVHSPRRTRDDYAAFLHPLPVTEDLVLEYHDRSREDLVTEEMRQAFEDLAGRPPERPDSG